MCRTISNVLLAGLIIVVLAACQAGDHFITDKNYRKRVEKQFEKQKELAKGRNDQLFNVFEQDLTTQEKEALVFLYAYMPLSDLADYDGEFFLKNVRSTLAARDTFAWGKVIPEEMVRHFVLPVRINNENLDSSRWVFFSELKDRIKKMTMRDAVLEVNHWCHEKVTYRGTDIRTSSPLATVKTAFGRCGEESTFTVAALRSVGIPARQCYTPRWAHSDDNHAWVEVWVDGKWHFIGACEPEPVLDMAWFTNPAKRAMLVNTNVFGDYEGPEDVLVRDPRFTRINILSNYTETKRIFVRVVNQSNSPVDSASVEFQLYNYAEFYPLHRCYTDNAGLCSFQTGYGDLLVWVAKGGFFGYTKVTVGETDTANVMLTLKPGDIRQSSFDFVPPPENHGNIELSDSLKEVNKTRLAFEDRTRENYEATFIDSLKASRLAETLGLPADTLWHFLKMSRGNWREITGFIAGVKPGQRHLLFRMLENLSEKDLRDVDPAVLSDHLSNSADYFQSVTDPQIFYAYVLSPRVDNERLKPWKGLFLEKMDKQLVERARKDPSTLIEWVQSNIAISTDANWGRAPLTPMGSFELKWADGHSRDILFVALCRSFGIPARLEPGSRLPQYFFADTWHDVRFERTIESNAVRSTLQLDPDPLNDRKPEYYTHFTVEQFKDGFFRSLDYENSPLVQTFPCALSISPGYYLMVTGNRLPGGTILTSLSFFNLVAGQTSKQMISLRKNNLPRMDFGRINPDLFNFSFPDGLVIAWVDRDKEPSKHLFADLRLKNAEIGTWKGRIILIFPSETQMKSFISRDATGLPKNVTYSFQETFPVKFSGLQTRRGRLKNLPVVAGVDGGGVIRYLTEGYKIGIGDDLVRIFGEKPGLKQ